MQNIFAEKTGSFTEIPFIIMVSEDTQRLTEALRKNQFFSLNPSGHIIKTRACARIK